MLTDTSIRNAKPAEKPFKLADGGGLFLLVNPTGSRLWRLKYRTDGKEKLLAIGAYPAISLAKAREKRDEAKALLADGVDPSAHKREQKREAELTSSNTFRLIAEEYVAKLKREGRADATLSKTEWLLGFAYAEIGDRPVTEIKPADVLAVLRRVEGRGTHETARRLRSTIGTIFRYAVAIARAENDPTFALRGALTAPTVKHRAAITDPKQLSAFLRSLDAFDGQPTTAAALRLLPILFPRPGELRAAEWKEFDLDKAVWTIPADRTKMRRAHRVPLPRQAVAIISGLKAITGYGRLLFPCVRSVTRPISENTLNAALRRLGYTADEVTAHGFRATASSLLNESGKWHSDAIERQLAHVEGNDVRRAYARGEYWDERVRMMQWWADWLEEISLSV
jgi:integrase